MFFIIWGFRRRVVNHGVVGPYTCPTCSWVGTFWLRQVQRQLRIYFIPVMKWSKGQFVTVCRNCGTGVEIDKASAEGVLASAQPIGAADPFGPPQAAPNPVADPHYAANPQGVVPGSPGYQPQSYQPQSYQPPSYPQPGAGGYPQATEPVQSWPAQTEPGAWAAPAWPEAAPGHESERPPGA